MTIFTQNDRANHLPFHPETTIKLSKSVRESIDKFVLRAEHENKKWPFYCFGNFTKENVFSFTHMMTLACNSTSSNGLESINNVLNHRLSNDTEVIMVGYIYPSSFGECEVLDVPQLNSNSGYIHAIISNNTIYAYFVAPMPRQMYRINCI